MVVVPVPPGQVPDPPPGCSFCGDVVTRLDETPFPVLFQGGPEGEANIEQAPRSRPGRMFDYAEYGWTKQPLMAFANEIVTIPGTAHYASYTRPAQYSDYAVIGGVAFAVGMSGNDMTLDYLDNKTGKVRKGRAVYQTQSAVMKRVSKVAGTANPGQQWPSKSFEYQGQANIEQAPGLRPRARCDVSCKTCVHYLAKGHTGKGYCQLYDFMTFKKWVCDSWKGQGVYSHEP